MHSVVSHTPKSITVSIVGSADTNQLVNKICPSLYLYLHGKKIHSSRTEFFNTMIYGKFVLRKDLVLKGISSAPWCFEEKISCVINYDYSEKIGLVEKTLILILSLKIFPNSCLEIN
jgi:hypothetical protein